MPGLQFPDAQNKAYDMCSQLDRHVTGTQNGIWVIEGPITTVRTGTSTEPDHVGAPQLLQQLPQRGVHLGKPAQVEGASELLVTFQGGSIQHVVQLAQPDSVAQQLLQDTHRDGVFTEAEGGELRAEAQSRQNVSDLRIHDPTLIQVQVLEGGRGSLYQKLEGPRTHIGQVEPAETQAFQLTDVQGLAQICEVVF